MEKFEILRKYLKENLTAIFVFILFCLITMFVSSFHEYWFDELQAWGVAKTNLHDILFFVPHYEGHPPFWFLILKFFQSFTTNPELVLQIPNMLLMYIAVYLLIFKSPFPKIVKYTLPFTYFIVYQYMINARPYSIIILGLFLAGYFYKKRDKHPFQYMAILALISQASVYGMLMTSCICIEWGLNILIQQKQEIKQFLTKDKRFFVMLGLFFLCLITAMLIIPAKDIYCYTGLYKLPILDRLVYFAFGLPADATAFNVYNYNTRFIESLKFVYPIIGMIFGCGLLIYLIAIFKQNKKLTLFLLGYFPLVLFMYLIYIQPQHIGLVFIMLIYLFWCLYSDCNEIKLPRGFKGILIFIFIVQVYWGGIALLRELVLEYSPTRTVVNFLKINKLTDYKIMCSFSESTPNVQWLSAQLNPYFGKNIVYTFNVDNPERCYVLHRNSSQQENMETFIKWIKQGKPDIFIGGISDENLKKYFLDGMTVVKRCYSGWIFKDSLSISPTDIYIRDTLIEELGKKSKENVENE